MFKLSKKQQMDELLVVAINTLVVAANKGVPPPMNVPYTLICAQSGRLEDITNHLRQVQIKMEKGDTSI